MYKLCEIFSLLSMEGNQIKQERLQFVRTGDARTAIISLKTTIGGSMLIVSWNHPFSIVLEMHHELSHKRVQRGIFHDCQVYTPAHINCFGPNNRSIR